MELVPKSPAGRAAHSLHLSAQSLSTFAASAPDPATDARCARNVAAAAALAAQAAAQTHDANNHESSQENDDRPGSLSSAAFRTVLKASQAAEAARSAGWMRPPRSIRQGPPADETGPPHRPAPVPPLVGTGAELWGGVGLRQGRVGRAMAGTWQSGCGR